ncbi:MAG: M6 family metalloprotease domain-containing protein [Muribaculaceae bacterium]|nr:M6 family metalloprotease domain-containing protein [Muribaculaceae bacterium]
MRKYILLLAFALMCVGQMFAVPAVPHPVKVTQPDGSSLSVRLNGDEFYHFYTTEDGYTVVKHDMGFFTYAPRVQGQLQPTAMVARNESERTAADKLYLSTVSKRMTDVEEVNSAKAAKAKRDAAASKARIDYSKFRGLIILVQFNDYPFSRSDANQFYTDMVNKKGYTGFTNEDGSAARWGSFTGSVRDFYEENSMGKFKPTFDIVGPITVPYSIVNSANTQSSIMRNALDQATKNYGVKTENYDCDGDGLVDMFYMIFAGVGANTGEADDHIWPHKSSTYVGRFRTYACSCEYYSKKSEILDGIGTICHEFSHVLGLPDLYDTDYANSGGESQHPGLWEIMAGGSYNNYSRTPVGYSAYDRYALGFSTPKVINATGDYTLNQIDTSNETMMIKSPKPKEFFLLENRQKNRWDAYIPGHGLLVARVDSSNASVWSYNTVNNNPDRNYYQLLRAGQVLKGEGDASDTYPGASAVTMLTNTTEANLKTFDGSENPWNIVGIQEDENGVISFKVLREGEIVSDIEDFETMPVTATSGATGVNGKFADWTFTKCNVAAPGAATKADGTHSVQMKLPSQFTSTATYYDAYQVSAKVFNPSASAVKMALTYSKDNGATWTAVKVNGETSQTVKGATTLTLYWPVDISRRHAVMYRIGMVAGSKTNPTFVDNFTIYYTAKGQEQIQPGDINEDGIVNVSDVTALINYILETATADPTLCDVNGDGKVDVSDVTALIGMILG